MADQPPLAGFRDLAGRTFLSATVTEGGMPRPMPAGSRVMLWFTPELTEQPG